MPRPVSWQLLFDESHGAVSKVSVVVPVYNKGPFLEACFGSIFAQTYRDLEIIAVDDASTDDSLARLRSFADPRLRIVALENNVGPGLAAQRGIDEAQGEFIVRMDADDVAVADRIALQVERLENDPGLGALGGRMALLDAPASQWRRPLEHQELWVELLFGVAIFQPTLALRKKVLVEHGIRYREHWPRYGEDWMLQIELGRVTRLANLDEPLVHYRVGPQNTVFGRDRFADLSLLFRHAFNAFGFPLSDADLELHMYTVRYFKHPPTPRSIREFRAWTRRLADTDRGLCVFDQRVLERRLEKAWDDLFHHLVGFGWRTTLAYLRAGGKLGWPRFRYMVLTLLSPLDRSKRQ